MSVKKNQVYAELEGKKRYLRVDDITDDGAVCTAGWRVKGNQIAWSHRHPTLPEATLSDTNLYRLEYDVE